MYVYIYINKYIYVYIYTHINLRDDVTCTYLLLLDNAMSVHTSQTDPTHEHKHTKPHANVQRNTHIWDCKTLLHTAIYCNTLPHTATHSNTLQYTATHCNTLQHTTTHCSTLQHTATHCNTLQHAATHCNTLQHTPHDVSRERRAARCSCQQQQRSCRVARPAVEGK